MSKRERQQDISATKSKKLKKERSVDEAKIEIINDLLDKIKEEQENKKENKDSTDGLGDTIKEIFQPILDEFKELIEKTEDKKYFIGVLLRYLPYF